MALVIDTTTAPSLDALRSAGVVGLCRYLSWPYLWGGVKHSSINPKIIQRGEYELLTGAGFGVALNWEYDAQDWLGGASAGSAHAAEAVRQAKALGYPAGCVVYGSADFNMTAAQWSSTGRAYAAAFATGITAGGYVPGVYGPWDVLTWCKALGGFRYFWQARMSTAWSGGRNARDWPGAHLYQRRQATVGGVGCDANDAAADFGQSPRPVSVPVAKPTEDDDMRDPIALVRFDGDTSGHKPAPEVFAIALTADGGTLREQVVHAAYAGAVAGYGAAGYPVQLIHDWDEYCRLRAAAGLPAAS